MKLSALAVATALFSGAVFAAPLTLQTYNPQEKGLFAVNSTLVADFGLHFIRSLPGLPLKPEQDKGVRMKSNHQARHLLGLNYKLSRQKKVVLEGDEETTINHIHATGRKRRGG